MHTRRIVEIEQQEIYDVAGVDLFVLGGIRLAASCAFQRRHPFLPGRNPRARKQCDAVAHLDEARRVFVDVALGDDFPEFLTLQGAAGSE